MTSASDDPVSRDPAVLAAQLAVREAREVYEPFEAAWLEVTAEHRREDLAAETHRTDGRGGLLSFGGNRRLPGSGSWSASAGTLGSRWNWPGATW